MSKIKEWRFFMELELGNKGKESDNFVIYHQNIMSLNSKKEEMSLILQASSIRPHIICISEHHMKKQEMLNFTLIGYKSASSFCQERFLKGGVCILIRNDISYLTIHLGKLCKEKVFEVCAVKLVSNSLNLIVCCIYRSPSGNPNLFLNLLERTFNFLHQLPVTFLACGDLNINFLAESIAKQTLGTVIKTFNLIQVVDFPTRISNNKGTLLDSVFIDSTKYDHVSVYSFVNGLSDHDAQIIILGNIKNPSRKVVLKNKIQVIDAQTIAKFQLLLKEETCDIVYDTKDVNSVFNNFHGIFLRHFEHSFPIIYIGYRPKNNEWIMNGIKISCMRKRNLYSYVEIQIVFM
jgi:hypothetical protein